jgi:hypothetical protein
MNLDIAVMQRNCVGVLSTGLCVLRSSKIELLAERMDGVYPILPLWS